MTRIDRLGGRLEKMQPQDSDKWRIRAEGEAYMAWVVRHLTSDEQMQLCQRIKAYNEGDAMDSDAQAIIYLGEERAAKKPATAYEDFRTKYVRAEVLRHKGCPLTDAEGDELLALNMWLQDV